MTPCSFHTPYVVIAAPIANGQMGRQMGVGQVRIPNSVAMAERERCESSAARSATARAGQTGSSERRERSQMLSLCHDEAGADEDAPPAARFAAPRPRCSHLRPLLIPNRAMYCDRPTQTPYEAGWHLGPVRHATARRFLARSASASAPPDRRRWPGRMRVECPGMRTRLRAAGFPRPTTFGTRARAGPPPCSQRVAVLPKRRRRSTWTYCLRACVSHPLLRPRPVVPIRSHPHLTARSVSLLCDCPRLVPYPTQYPVPVLAADAFARDRRRRASCSPSTLVPGVCWPRFRCARPGTSC